MDKMHGEVGHYCDGGCAGYAMGGTVTEEKDASIIPEDIKDYVRAVHKDQRESRPDENWRIARSESKNPEVAPYKKNEDAEPVDDSAIRMARGGVVPGYSDGAFPDMDAIDSEIAPQGTGILTPSPDANAPQPIVPDIPAAPTPPPAAPVVKAAPSISDLPALPAAPSLPSMTDADYVTQAEKMLGTQPGQQSDILKALGQAQQRGSIGTAIAGLGDAIAQGGTLGKVNPGGAQRSQELIQNRTTQGLEGLKSLQANKEKATELAQKLEAQDPNSPVSKYAQKAYGDVGKKIGIDLSHASASLIADVTGKGVQELSDEAQLAVRKEGLDIQRGTLEQAKEANRTQREIERDRLDAETANQRAQRGESDQKMSTEAGHDIATRTLGRKLTDTILPYSATAKADARTEAIAAGAKPFDSEEQAKAANLPKGTRVYITGRGYATVH